MNDNIKNNLIYIVGPTASGKTDTAVYTAQKLNGSIISADSMQIYKYMDIGSAKPDNETLSKVKHYMIGEVYPDENFNVSIYQKRAFDYIGKIISENKIPLIVGGTGLYVNSLLNPMNFAETKPDEKYRDYLNSIADKCGNQAIYDILKEKDSITAEKLHINDRKRIIRSLEIIKGTGRQIKQNRIFDITNNYNNIIIGLNMDRDILYKRINKRVDIMMKSGLLDEVKNLLELGYDTKLPAMQGLGYKELIFYFKGKCTLNEAIELIKKNTRHYAKRQITWFKRYEGIQWFDMTESDNYKTVYQSIYSYIMQKLL